MSWLDNYKAAKAQPPGQQGYAPPPPAYGALAAYQGPPAHAPFGFDPNTGVPVAPYGRDQYGQIITQPPVAYDPRGMPLPPQGYYPGQQPGQGQPNSGWQEPPLDPNGKIHYMEAAARFRGTPEAQMDVKDCPRCGGMMFQRTHGSVMNTTTGTMARPAPECENCGYNGKWDQAGSGAGMDGLVTEVEGGRHYARGGQDERQAAHQHGLPNLFAKKNDAAARGRARSGRR